ncbi:MAG TPA: chromosome segregation protein SMC [Terriglobia bacterium]|jgi:chromosome segregation protein
MLKLRRIEILGFKSFSDRGEITVNEAGVTAIVGPNGCGKSNVSDAIAWVLGEQSAKSLRGEKMEDVIFNGTRNRKPMGMAEVTITLSQIGNGNGNGNGNGHGNGNGNGSGNGNGHDVEHAAPPAAPVAGPRDVTVQRRLYRSGESMYLIDGKICRLRDIQDIFLGTGLGPNSYAIIEQGRVGQLLSSKPTDRRGLIEEAAGITKFKAKRKLAESRLEAARLNLSRVNDILAEVDRQRNSLKRQAGKARRYIELRNRMRDVLSAVYSTRAEMLVDQQEKIEISLALMTNEGKHLEQEIERLNALVHQRRFDVGESEHKLEGMRDRRSEIELEHEKTVQRIERLHDQIKALEDRKVALAADQARALEELEKNGAEREARTVQLAAIDDEKIAVEANVAKAGAAVSDCVARRNEEERTIERLRQQQFEMVGREARLRNEVASRRDTIARISGQIDRLQKEEAEAREQEALFEAQLAAAREEYAVQQAGFSQLKTQLQLAEESFSKNKQDHAGAVKAAAEARAHEESIRHRLKTIGDLAVQRAYSTESVQQFFNAVRGLEWAPLGILADFVEVEPDFEALVEDFLRWKLQYVVVQDRTQAERAIDIVKTVSKGRLDCLVLNGHTTPAPPAVIEGARPLAEVVRFDDRVRHFSDYVRDAYIVDTADRAWELAAQYPQLEFVARTGEMVRGHVISWGEHEDHGPLSLKREIRELDAQLDTAQRQTTVWQDESIRLEDLVRESEALKGRLAVELQEAEKTMLNTDHRVRSLSGDVQRAAQRLRVAVAEIERLTAERAEVEKAAVDAELALTEVATQKRAVEEEIQLRSRLSEELRIETDELKRGLAGLQSQLAVLQERRSTVAREITALTQQAEQLNRRSTEAAAQIQQAQEQQIQTEVTIESLEVARAGLVEEGGELDAAITVTTSALEELRRELHEAEAKWDETRALLDSWKDRHNALEIEKTQVESDLKHLAESCVHELNETIEAVCLKYFEALPPTELEVREKEYHELRDKMDSMGAVNMMAVEEYQEAEERFAFLSTQRQDLLDSIRDTTQAIEEIDAVCRRQFKEAFEAINAGFKEAFVTLFGGGMGELRLLEGAGETDAGVEIVASPPGKKLQNVLLLSGGEKALTALALLIALFRYKPSPFCVLDEVDAPLDEANVDRFAQMVRDMSSTTQFIVITHSKRTMETASQLYGVTMEEPGISKIVSVRLN